VNTRYNYLHLSLTEAQLVQAVLEEDALFLCDLNLGTENFVVKFETNNKNMSRRLSIGGSALRESSSRHNTRPLSTPLRRQSFGGNQLDYQSDGDVKSDRMALLNKWRRERGDAAARMPTEVEPAAASLPSSSNSESRSALERFRDRKRIERQQENELPPRSTHPPPAASRSTFCFDDDEDYGRGGSTFMSSGTPSFNRRIGGSASKARRRSYSVDVHGRNMSLSQEREGML